MVGVRYRPPPPPSTNLLTRAGYERLRAELDTLWRSTRPEVVKALADAAAEGDRSENAEYTYRKKQLGEIDRRVRFLTRRLAEVRVVEGCPADAQAVFFGALVQLEHVDGRSVSYRIVGPDEVAHDQLHLSIDSPLARALLRKRVDDEVRIAAPGGDIEVCIVAIRYD